MRGKQLRAGYVIAVEKLMKTLVYIPKVPGMPKDENLKMKDVMKLQIIRQHNQIFSAAGMYCFIGSHSVKGISSGCTETAQLALMLKYNSLRKVAYRKVLC